MSSTRRSPLAVRDFRLLWLGEAISSLGDQFSMVALPWLALLLTGSGLALGTVLALMAIPRAVLMIVGGAYVDRLSPRRVMLASNVVRFVSVAALGALVLAGTVEPWMLYPFALVYGVASAFFWPAQGAIVPELVAGDQLQKANGIVQGTAQLSVFAGPALAGVAIAALGTAGDSVGQAGVGAALLIDALTFLASLGTLLLIANRPVHAASDGSVIRQIAEGVGFVWRAPAMRVVMGLSMGANFFIVGPFDVGLPVIAYTRLPEGAAAFGLIVSAFGGGSLLGMAAATMLPALPRERFGTVVLLLLAISGLGMAGMAFTRSTMVAVALAGGSAVAVGYTNLLVITWVQRRIPRRLMGRVMSLLMFSSAALVPISMAVAGVAVQVSPDGLFLVGGLSMSALTLVALASASVRRMGLEPTVDEPEGEPGDPSELADSSGAEATAVA